MKESENKRVEKVAPFYIADAKKMMEYDTGNNTVWIPYSERDKRANYIIPFPIS
jgi:hypothetical protein